MSHMTRRDRPGYGASDDDLRSNLEPMPLKLLSKHTIKNSTLTSGSRIYSLSISPLITASKAEH
jgi:hypothetical protein